MNSQALVYGAPGLKLACWARTSAAFLAYRVSPQLAFLWYRVALGAPMSVSVAIFLGLLVGLVRSALTSEEAS